MIKQTLVAISILLITSVSVGGELITIKAFGYTLGEPTDVSGLKKLETSSHAGDEYAFTPEKPYGIFDTYIVRVTPKAKRVFYVEASAKVETRAECESEFGAVTTALDKKYGKGKDNIAASMAGVKQLRYKGKNGRIVAQCMTMGGYEASVNYIADDIEKAAIRERGELLSGERNDGSL